MTATISSDGQIALPKNVRARLGLEPGMKLDCRIEADQIVLRPTGPQARRKKARIGISQLTGLPILIPPADAPPLTPEMVKKVLADFP